jgi:hypothetical protein
VSSLFLTFFAGNLAQCCAFFKLRTDEWRNSKAKQISCDLNTIVLGAGIEVHNIGINLLPLYMPNGRRLIGISLVKI